MRKPFLLASTLLALGYVVAYTQEVGHGESTIEESLDSLFEANQDGVAVEDESDMRAVFETDSRPVVSGSFKSTGGAAFGWREVNLKALEFTEFDGTIGVTSEATLRLDARPTSSFRFFASVSTSVDPFGSSVGWSYPSGFSEAYADYSGVAGLFARVGKFSSSWGQGKVFNPGDLVSDLSTGFALRLVVPLSRFSVSGIAFMKDGFFDGSPSPSWKDLGYLARIDASSPGLTVSAGARYQVDEGLKAMAGAKAIVGGFDLYADAVISTSLADYGWVALFGVYKDWTDMVLAGEQIVGGDLACLASIRSAVAIGFNNLLFGNWDLGFRIEQDWIDSSGSIWAAFAFPMFEGLQMQVFSRAVYGLEGTYYRNRNEDPSKRMLAFGLIGTLSFDF